VVAQPAKPNGHCGVCRGQKIVDSAVVGQAENILLQWYSIGAQEAFAMLAQVSQDTDRSRVGVAQDFVHTRDLPNHHTSRDKQQHLRVSQVCTRAYQTA